MTCPRAHSIWPISILAHFPEFPITYEEEHQMTADNIVDNVKGLVVGMSSSRPGPYKITVPAGTNLREFTEGENMSLEDRLKDVEGVKEVVVGTGPGVSIESIPRAD